MRLTISALLTFAVLTIATPPHEQAKRNVNCDDCNKRFKFCVDNGWAHGIDKCASTCARHVCYQTPDCRGCGDDFEPCPEVSRYHKGCGDRKC